MNAQASETSNSSVTFRDVTSPLFSKYQTYIDTLPVIAWTLSNEGTILHSNKEWLHYTGLEDTSLHRRTWWSWLPASEQKGFELRWLELASTRTKFDIRCQLPNQIGNYEWHQIIFSPSEPATAVVSESELQDENASSFPYPNLCYQWTGLAFNIQSLQDEYALLEANAKTDHDMLNASVDCIKMMALDGTLLRMNHSGCIALGLNEECEFGMKWVALVPKSMKSQVRRAVAAAAAGKKTRFSGTSQIPGGNEQHWDNILTPILNADGNPTAILCVSREITLQRAAEARLRAASERDPLTGLLNRKAFAAKAKHWITQARRNQTCLALALIDLDHFKPINDSYGHPVGDHILKEVAKRIENAFPNASLSSRIGGDEFAVIIRDQNRDREAFISLIQRCLGKIALPITYGGKQINSGMSCGVSFYPQDATELSEWMRKSDVALTETKNSCKGSIKLFCESMNQKNFCSLAQLKTIRNLLNKDSFEVSYSKRCQLVDSHALIGFGSELLLKPELTPLLGNFPNDILYSNHSIANEASALLRNLVIDDLSQWVKRRKPSLPVTLRTPSGELMRQEFAEQLLTQLDKQRVAPHLIEIEAQESIFNSRSSELAIRTLKELREAGVQICLGEFGDGLTSLSQLSSYPIDSIRLSPNFTEMAKCDPVSATILGGICRLCIELKLSISSRGIHTSEDVVRLQAMGCQSGEGPLFGKFRNKQSQKNDLPLNAVRS